MSSGRVLLLMLLAGCTSPFAGESELEVRTSAATYHVGAVVPVSIVNRSDGALYVAHCNNRASLLLERRAGDAWEVWRQVNGPLCLTIYPMGELRIDAGTSLTDSLHIDAAGEFRLRLGARRAHEDFGSLSVTSPPFLAQWPPD
jgi:hypothetical protein